MSNDDNSKDAEFLKRASGKQTGLVSEFIGFLKVNKKWWLAPLIGVLLLLGSIIIFAEGSAIAPFIYTIF